MGGLPSLQSTFHTEEVTIQGYGTHYGIQGKNISGLHKTKVGKGMDLGDLGTSMGKEREKDIKWIVGCTQLAGQCTFMTMHRV